MAESKPSPKTDDAATTYEAPQGADITKSRQAHFSTYARREVDPKTVDENPPPGPITEQELGTPTEGAVKSPIKAPKS